MLNVHRNLSIICRLQSHEVGYVKNYHSAGVYGFKGRDNPVYVVPEEVLKHRSNYGNFYRLVTAYRKHGHKQADINPVALAKCISFTPELNPKRYGLNINDVVNFEGIVSINKQKGSICEAIEFLNDVYSKHMSAEFLYLEDEEEREWFSKKMEDLAYEKISSETKILIATEMLKSQAFDNFLAIKFTGLKRYGGEGAESMMAFFSEFFRLSAEAKIEQIVLAMPHRGRLNLLTGMLNFSPTQIFTKLKGNPDFPEKYQGTGDVLSHCIASTDLHYGNNSVHITLLYNPSHLEAVNPVSMGKTRAKQQTRKEGDYREGENCSDKTLNVQVHGDAALMGQGINQECMALSKAPHFDIGGTVHLVVNNQVGFTTPADTGRSSRYCTDVAKVISAPVLHVNGDYPEAVLKATRLVFEYRRKFRKDIFLDINCFRQWGHNELDDPTFTNPSLYSIIKSRKTIPNLYVENLIEEGTLKGEEAKNIIHNHSNWLNGLLKSDYEKIEPTDHYFKQQWAGLSQAQATVSTWDTGYNLDILKYVGNKSVKFPANFNIHPTLSKSHIKNRITKIAEGNDIDWATAEAMAFGSLLYEGYNVRISGQDVGRGTFSHRHAMLVDQKTNNIYIPLNNIDQDQKGFLEIANSILSEEAVLGYEYGMSIENPNNLVIWEAQFGDFFNGAQIIFDTFITTGETKWILSSGLTILLPHGYDGAGPEHSSSRIERFLQSTDSKLDAVDGDNVNMHVCQPSTPAQYFHLLRRQIVRDFRKPLIVIAPKTLIRLSEATSPLDEMAPGTSFKPVISDPFVNPNDVRKILITSGKHFYILQEKRQSLMAKDTAIIRVESFCPFPTLDLLQEVSKYKKAKVIIWCQEEPQNMGAWTFMKPRFENLIGRKIQYCGRKTSAAPAVGIGKLHQQQIIDIVTKPFQIKC